MSHAFSVEDKLLMDELSNENFMSFSDERRTIVK